MKRRWFEGTARRTSRSMALVALVLALQSYGCDLSDNLNVTLNSGSLEVRTVTGGVDIDPDGYQFEVTGAVALMDIGVNDTVLSDVFTGDRTVRLFGIAGNCSVDANPQSVRVRKNRTVTVIFNVTCS